MYTATSGVWSVNHRLPDCIARDVDSIRIKFMMYKCYIKHI